MGEPLDSEQRQRIAEEIAASDERIGRLVLSNVRAIPSFPPAPGGPRPRVEIIDTQADKVVGIFALDEHGVAVPSDRAAWVLRVAIFGQPGTDEPHILRPEDGEVYLRGVEREFTHATYVRARYVGLTEA